MLFEHLLDDKEPSRHYTIRWRLTHGDAGDLILQLRNDDQRHWTNVVMIDAVTGRLIRVYNEGALRANGLPVDETGKIVVV